jgi:CHAT domain-containing protein
MAEDGMRLAEETNQPRLSAWLLMNLAGIDVAEQRYDQALERLAASRRRFAGQGQRGSLALSLAATAAVYADRQLDAEALEWAAKAQTEARASGYVDALWIALDAGGRASRHAGRREEARAAFREQIALNESARPQLAGGEAEKGQFLSSRTHPYYALMEMAVEDGRFEEALQSLEAAKARALVDIIENGRADPGPLMTEAERREDQRLAAAVESGTAAALRGDAAARSRWDDAKRDLTVFRTALYAVHPELKLRRGQFAAFRLGDAADLVPDARTLLVEFALSGGRLFAFTLARDARGEAALRVTSSEWNADEAARQVEAFRASLAERSLGYRQAARALYGRIFSPVAEQLRGKSVVGIVPDGVLWGVPLQALVGPDGRHVLEDHAIFYAPSLTALREIRQRRARTPATNAAVLAFGAPAAEKFAGALAPLLDSAREVELVGAVYGRGASAVSTGAAARKSVWMREAPRWGVLHLATHGEVNTNNPLYSYLVLSDGVIEAREILGLDLHAQLVVLSACETGLGSVTSGEGLIGLSWAFLVAGSPAALVSQWKVDSRSTGELMAEFHRAYRAGGYAAARALQRAALATIRVPGYHHPFYWAAFVVLGAGY